MPGQRSYVKGFVLRAKTGIPMLKPSEFKVLKDEEIAGIDKACEVIDKLLDANRADIELKMSQARGEVVRAIARRYQNEGWIVTAARGSQFVIGIKHPDYHTR